MSFTFLSAGWVVTGVAALAATLFALQRLRVRHRDVTVITTMFWAEAVRESRARVLVDRFRHPLAYLLLLVVASLLWIGAAGPRMSGGADGRHVVLLDASARMGRTGRFDAAVASLREDVATLPRDRTRVVLCGRTPRTLLLAGENALLLDERLAELSAEPVAESVTRTLHELLVVNDGPLTVRLHGDAPLPEHDVLPDDVVVVRAGPGPVAAAANAGVTALGLTDAASGAWTVVDVFVEVRGAPLPEASAVQVAWTEATALPDPTVERAPDRLALRFRDVPANGATLTVTLAGGDALALDDTAEVVLPRRTPIRVLLPETLGGRGQPKLRPPEPLRRALANDPAIRIVGEGEDADVVVAAGRAPDEGPPTFLLSNGTGGAFVLVDPETNQLSGGNAAEVARRAVRELALDRIDATGLATQVARPIDVVALHGDVRIVAVWDKLFSVGYDFVADDAFPVFVARSMRRLAEVSELDAEISASTSLVSPAETLAVTTPVGGDAPAPGGGAPDLAVWAGLVAGVLLCAEWVLHRQGRIP